MTIIIDRIGNRRTVTHDEIANILIDQIVDGYRNDYPNIDAVPSWSSLSNDCTVFIYNVDVVEKRAKCKHWPAYCVLRRVAHPVSHPFCEFCANHIEWRNIKW